MDLDKMLEILVRNGADVLIVAVVVIVTFSGYYVLPGPRDKNGDRILKVNPPWDSVLFIAPFFLGVILSVILDLDKTQPLVGKIRDGLATGAYAMAVERAVFIFLAKRLREAQGAVQQAGG